MCGDEVAPELAVWVDQQACDVRHEPAAVCERTHKHLAQVVVVGKEIVPDQRATLQHRGDVLDRVCSNAARHNVVPGPEHVNGGMQVAADCLQVG